MGDSSTDSRFESVEARIIQLRDDMTATQGDVRGLQAARARDSQRLEDQEQAANSVVEAFKAQRAALYTVGVLIIVAALTVLALGHP